MVRKVDHGCTDIQTGHDEGKSPKTKIMKTGKTSVQPWPENLSPLPHQLEALEWVTSRDVSYLAADPGLGKTIVAAMAANKLTADVFYISPPFLLTNVRREFAKWAPGIKIHLIPDSVLTKESTLKETLERLKTAKRPLLFIDEAHRFKNESAQRTKALFKKFFPHFNRVIFMSGTPLPNGRPKEVWSILKHATPETFGTNFFQFGLKYCGGRKGPFGWDFDGFTNRKEFIARITRKFMLRQKQALLKLPPKREGLLVIGDKLPKEVSGFEKKILSAYNYEDIVSGQVKKAADVEGEVHLATYLRILGKFKLKYMIPVIEDLLETTDESVLIFAIHKDVVSGLETALTSYRPLVITGDVPKNLRDERVRKFQSDPTRRVFIGNIQACGVGFTLTKATRVIFTEFSWVDGDNSQASDRAYRIGQTKSVLVQYAVLDGSIDHTRMETVLQKRRKAI